MNLVNDIHDGILRLDESAARGVKSKGSVETCISRVFMNIFGIDRFPGIFMKAAGLLYSFAGPFHPYIDGNKRTALVVAHVFLLVNGYSFYYPPNALQFMLSVAQDKINDTKEIAKWLEQGCIKNELYSMEEDTRLQRLHNRNLSLYGMFEISLQLKKKQNDVS